MTSTLNQTQGVHQPIYCAPLGYIRTTDGFSCPFYEPIPGFEHLTSHLVESIPSYNLPSEVHTLPSEVHNLPSEICVPEQSIPEEVRPDNSKSGSPKYITLETEEHRSSKRKRTTTVVSNDNFNIMPAAPLLENNSPFIINTGAKPLHYIQHCRSTFAASVLSKSDPESSQQSFESATEPDDTMLRLFSLPYSGPSASHIQAGGPSNMYQHSSLPHYNQSNNGPSLPYSLYSYNQQGH
jgi:hypothetical protein